MSFLHPVEPRLCKVCGHKWFAEANHSRVRPGPVLFSAHQNTGLAYSRGKYEQWRHCPQCGTNKVKRVAKAGFVPSAAEAHHSVVVQSFVGARIPAPAPERAAVPEQWAPPSATSTRGAPPPPSPLRQVPGDSWIRDSFASARRVPLRVGDHVHEARCAENGCDLLDQSVGEPSRSDYARAILAALVGVLIVWPVQYCCVTPLAGLRYASSTSRTRGWGVVAVVCGLGFFVSLAYLAMPQVPRAVLTPWGVFQQPSVGTSTEPEVPRRVEVTEAT